MKMTCFVCVFMFLSTIQVMCVPPGLMMSPWPVKMSRVRWFLLSTWSWMLGNSWTWSPRMMMSRILVNSSTSVNLDSMVHSGGTSVKCLWTLLAKSCLDLCQKLMKMRLLFKRLWGEIIKTDIVYSSNIHHCISNQKWHCSGGWAQSWTRRSTMQLSVQRCLFSIKMEWLCFKNKVKGIKM